MGQGKDTIPASSSAAASYTVAYFDAEGGRTFTLKEGASYTLGRSHACDIVVRHPSVSRNHAMIIGGSPPSIKDLGSGNGTRVSGRRLTPNVLAPMDVGNLVQVGEVVLLVQRAIPHEDPNDGPLEAEGTTSQRNDKSPLPLIRSSIPPAIEDMVAEDPRARDLYRIVGVVADSELGVLILGETGVGKERIAHAVHALSKRAQFPLVCLNCAALPESLVESELFGFERGALPGATQGKEGFIARADRGTLFLDEVNELSLPVQAKLLRAIESGEILPVGARDPVKVDVRFLAATNRNLRQAVTAGTFREDLYYRLNGLTLYVPALRERPGDIIPLAMSFATRAAARLQRPPPSLSPEVRQQLLAFPWPGNVRELKNVIERAVILTGNGSVITPEALHLDPVPAWGEEGRTSGALLSSGAALAAAKSPSLEERLGTPREVSVDAHGPSEAIPGKRRILYASQIRAALEHTGGDQKKAAEMLGVSRRTLINWLDRFALPRPRKKN